MRDSRLFQHIQTLIRERQNSRPSQPLTFAERYCQEQMIKKKLNVNKRGQKMAHLMRNFRGLQTFVDLPQLIEAVKRWRFDQMKQEKQNSRGESRFFKKRQQQPTMTTLFKSQKSEGNLGQKIKKQLGDRMKQRYIVENSIADQLLESLEQTTTINSAGLKNNSANNINLLYEKVSDQGQDKTWRGGMEFLSKLNESQSMMSLGTKEELNKFGSWLDIKKPQQESNVNEGEMSLRLRKQYTKLLHKITTYIQIVLQTEHRQKWEAKNVQNSQHHQCKKSQQKRMHKTLIINRKQLYETNDNKENTPDKNQTDKNQTDKISNRNPLPMASIINKNKQKLRLRTIVTNKTTITNKSNNSCISLSKFKAQFQQQHNNNLQTLPRNKSQFIQSDNQNQKQQKQYSIIPQKNQIRLTKLKKQAVFLHRKQFSEYPLQKSVDIQHDNDQNSEIDIRLTTTSMRTDTINSLQPKQNHLRSIKHQRSDSFLRTTSSSNLRQQAIRKRREGLKSQTKLGQLSSFSMTNNSFKGQSTVKDTFTFRNRNIKQKIINRLGSFIRQIDQQEHNNKKQNSYYLNAINKLQNTLSLCFGQFRQEDVAGERDIQMVKKYANVFGNGGMGPVSSKFINFDDGADCLGCNQMTMKTN